MELKLIIRIKFNSTKCKIIHLGINMKNFVYNMGPYRVDEQVKSST